MSSGLEADHCLCAKAVSEQDGFNGRVGLVNRLLEIGTQAIRLAMQPAIHDLCLYAIQQMGWDFVHDRSANYDFGVTHRLLAFVAKAPAGSGPAGARFTL